MQLTLQEVQLILFVGRFNGYLFATFTIEIH